MTWYEFDRFSLETKITTLFKQGQFIMSIRYYGYKVNLYLLNDFYLEVFYNHKLDKIEKISLLDSNHSRMNFYYDQIKIPV
jgi:hypothetical protein